jgi:hypothetical protein
LVGQVGDFFGLLLGFFDDFFFFLFGFLLVGRIGWWVVGC